MRVGVQAVTETKGSHTTEASLDFRRSTKVRKEAGVMTEKWISDLRFVSSLT